METVRREEMVGNLRFREPFVPTLAEHIADEIVRLRIQFDLTQEELANKIGTTQSAISRAESGNNLPSSRFLEKIATALGVRLVVRYDTDAVVEEAEGAVTESSQSNVIVLEDWIACRPPDQTSPWQQPETTLEVSPRRIGAA